MTTPYNFPHDTFADEIHQRFTDLEAGGETGVTVAVASTNWVVTISPVSGITWVEGGKADRKGTTTEEPLAKLAMSWPTAVAN